MSSGRSLAPRLPLRSRLSWVCFVCGLLAASSAVAAPNDSVDISSGGTPLVQGALGNAAVIANPDNLADLAVTVDFGELSPLNRSGMVVVRIPVSIRSMTPYELRASVSGATFGSDPLSLRPADIGFGIQNFRPMANARACRNHQILSGFDNDPTVTAIGSARVTYATSLANIGTSTPLMRGPLLSKGAVKPRKADNGWLLDVVLAVVPQFFVAGTSSITITLSITEAASPSCI